MPRMIPRAGVLWSRRIARRPTFRFRTCRSPCLDSAGSEEAFRGGVAIGDFLLDLGALHSLGLLSGMAAEAVAACARPTLNEFMSLGAHAWSALRQSLSQLLQAGSAAAPRLQSALIAQSAAQFAVPAQISDYTDFYASIYHATTVGRVFRPDNPLLPNYKWVPIAYHGRASSIRVSGYDFQRPAGQVMPPGAQSPQLRPSQRLDYELEVGDLHRER